ncbi:uncharacterized protein LAESUDRAFT_645459 [Laetiporus sulphureus 93-53]|uniref:GAR domain-containing protein n=1 Tax=Laetiporus sulphureus 93-53 TaxID=1314785 RepID=A0A165G8R3_9APHY|nr:uncharacterized protein LAESUDRAFT_645459 [Laetiporus sulphureus 93-53]KZT09987.1 hypothetical protein LAESUDRAFT_645459 [Laetiporus sulphureus 93-53]
MIARDLHVLAASSRITELSYSMSDIQTRMFEIQELRHKSQDPDDSSSATKLIDQSLGVLDERVRAASASIRSVNETLTPLLESSQNGRQSTENAMILHKHADMMAEWEALQQDIQVLRDELKEDKWLTVFRTVTDQANGMMSSLEKAVNNCQELVWRVQRHGIEEPISPSASTSSLSSEKPLTYETFNAAVESYEARKKHYMSSTTKVLSILDKGVQDRVTKNGECLRRHAESTQRWKNLRERITRIDKELDAVRRMLTNDGTLSGSSSDAGSHTSAAPSAFRTSNGLLATPSMNGSWASLERSLSSDALSRSLSPFRKLAHKLKSHGPSQSPESELSPLRISKRVLSEGEGMHTLKHRASVMNFTGSQPPIPSTPSHKHTQSLTPDTSPSNRKLERLDTGSTLKFRPAWNNSTKVESDERSATVKQSPARPSLSILYRYSEDVLPNHTQYPNSNRSASRSSMASSRPWSPVTSSASTAPSNPPVSMPRPPSRARSQISGQPLSVRPPSRSQVSMPSEPLSPRTRPKTPSHIPTPMRSHIHSISTSPSDPICGLDDLASSLHKATSSSMARPQTPGGSTIPARPPSRSMIPVPSVHVSSASRPSSAMSHYRPDSSMSFSSPALRSRRSEGLPTTMRTPRASLISNRLPPSSFRESMHPRTPSGVSRPPSRAGAATPSLDRSGEGNPVHEYIPVSLKDPLDAEIAAVANSLAHNLVIERLDPPLKGTPKENEEIRAQYAFTGPLVRKVVACKLTTLARPGAKGPTKKVMCRVGGGWQDLRQYVLSRQT